LPALSVCRFGLTRKRVTGQRAFIQPRGLCPRTDQPEHLRRTTLLKSSQPRTPAPPAAGGATATRPVRSSARRSATPPVAPDERSELQVSWVGVSSVSRPRHYSRTSRHPPGSFEDTRRRSSSLSRYFARC